MRTRRRPIDGVLNARSRIAQGMAFQLREKFESLPASNGDFKLALRVSFVLFWLSVGLEYFNRGTQDAALGRALDEVFWKQDGSLDDGCGVVGEVLLFYSFVLRIQHRDLREHLVRKDFFLGVRFRRIRLFRRPHRRFIE